MGTHEPAGEGPHPAEPTTDRRSVSASGAAMAAGLVAGYGAFAWIAARFLYPSTAAERGWLYVARIADLAVGSSLRYRTPGGATVNITRRGSGTSATDFVALSSTCPHLGCQVHWQADQNRYFCPCHNGVFDATGKGTGGPPGDAGQSLKPFDLRVDSGLLFIDVPLQGLAAAERSGEILPPCEGPQGPGHDPCLQPRSCRSNPGFPA